MIDPTQLAICKQRGHDPVGDDLRWVRCKHCGTWTRTVRTVEERESEPPKQEQGIDDRIRDLVRSLESRAEGRIK